MNNDIKLLLKNNTLLSYFNDIIFGKFDDGELHNFLITNASFKDTFFIVSESNDESSLSSFVKNNIISNNLLKDFTEIPDKLEEKNIIYSPTNYSIVVLTLEKTKTGIEINTLGIFEWLLSNMLFQDGINNINDSLKLLTITDYSLFALNYNDISKDFTKLLEDENLMEIINTEDI